MSDSQSDLVRVLVVDDEAALRDMLTAALTREGHVVLALDSAEAALSALPNWTFDAALLDQRLPGMDGILLGEYLRKNNPTIEVALMTGVETKHLERHARKLGIHFLRKPFDLDAVFEVIDAAKRTRSNKQAQERNESNEDFAPPIARFAAELTETFRMPHAPQRLGDALVDAIKHHMSELRHDRHYDERSRVAALAGLLTARVLGVDLPHGQEGKSLYEEYDAIMQKRGKRTEFDGT